mmetsp:Transcript_9923/g.17273  ORF Transcript_9923/g.17273 Transcript_9923/m.17273 type:complete len:93 (+) Transcript_9923:382-660(+)
MQHKKIDGKYYGGAGGAAKTRWQHHDGRQYSKWLQKIERSQFSRNYAVGLKQDHTADRITSAEQPVGIPEMRNCGSRQQRCSPSKKKKAEKN